MLQLNDIPSGELAFDIHSKDFVKTISDKIPEFKDYNGEVEKKKLFIYIVIMYDRNTPLAKEYRDYFERKFEAGRLSGFKLHRGESYVKGVEDCILGYDDIANGLMAAYISYFSDPKYHQLQMLLFIRDQKTRLILNGTVDRDDHKFISSINKEIDDTTRDLLMTGGEDDRYELKKKLYAKADNDRKLPTPETVAEYLSKDGDVPDDYNPYPDYKPDDLKFIGDSEEVAELKLKKTYGKKKSRKTKQG